MSWVLSSLLLLLWGGFVLSARTLGGFAHVFLALALALGGVRLLRVPRNQEHRS